MAEHKNAVEAGAQALIKRFPDALFTVEEAVDGASLPSLLFHRPTLPSWLPSLSLLLFAVGWLSVENDGGCLEIHESILGWRKNLKPSYRTARCGQQELTTEELVQFFLPLPSFSALPPSHSHFPFPSLASLLCFASMVRVPLMEVNGSVLVVFRGSEGQSVAKEAG